MGSKLTFIKQLRGLLSDLLPSLGIIPTANLGSGTADATTFLRGDQSYAAAIAGTTGTNDNRILRSDGTGGGTAQSSNATLDDTGNLTVFAGLLAGSGSFAVTTAFDVLVWQGGKLGFASAAVGVGSTGDAYFVRNGVSSIGVKGSGGVDAALTAGAITTSGNVNIGANSLVGTYSGIYNDGKWLTGSDNYGSFYISPSNAAFAFSPPAAGAIVGTIDFAGRFNATTGFAVGSSDNSTTTVRYYRNATGPKASIRAAGGLEVKDLAGSADAALTCGALTASDATNFAPITKAALLMLTPNAATGGRWRVTDATPPNRAAYPTGTDWRYTSDDTVVT